MADSKGGSPAAFLWALVVMAAVALSCLLSDKPGVVAAGTIVIISAAVMLIEWLRVRRVRR